MKLVVLLIALLVSASASAGDRWKLGPDGCKWAVDDSTQNQCDPNEPVSPYGRYKLEGTSCLWVADGGTVNQCDPLLGPPTDPPEVTDETVPDFYDTLGEDENNYQSLAGIASCAQLVVKGNLGYLAMQVTPEGGIAWGAFMNNWSHNFGLWNTILWFNSEIVEFKQQFRNPHGSFLRGERGLGPGTVVKLNVQHLFPAWTVFPVYDAREGRIVYVGMWSIGYATGNLTCLMPPFRP